MTPLRDDVESGGRVGAMGSVVGGMSGEADWAALEGVGLGGEPGGGFETEGGSACSSLTESDYTRAVGAEPEQQQGASAVAVGLGAVPAEKKV